MTCSLAHILSWSPHLAPSPITPRVSDSPRHIATISVHHHFSPRTDAHSSCTTTNFFVLPCRCPPNHTNSRAHAPIAPDSPCSSLPPPPHSRVQKRKCPARAGKVTSPHRRAYVSVHVGSLAPHGDAQQQQQRGSKRGHLRDPPVRPSLARQCRPKNHRARARARTAPGSIVTGAGVSEPQLRSVLSNVGSVSFSCWVP
jgi:hypothetical protein